MNDHLALTSPLEIEQQYQRAIIALSQALSDNHKIEITVDFIQKIAAVRRKDILSSYLLQIWSLLAYLLRTANLKYYPPEKIQAYLAALEQCRDYLGDQNVQSEYQGIRELLLRQLALTYLYLGEIQKGFLGLLRCAPGETGRRLEGASAEPQLRPEMQSRIEDLAARGCSNYELFEQIRESMGQTVPGIADELQQLHETWTLVENSRYPDKVKCLLVDRSLFPEVIVRAYSYELTVVASTALRGDGLDTVKFHNTSRTLRNEIEHYAEDAVSAARSLYIKKLGQPRGGQRGINFIFSFPEKSASYSGYSFGLAAGLLAYNQILKLRQHRGHYLFPLVTGITGGVGPSGEVLPVDDYSLREKIEAAFFSPLKYLVLPYANRQAALSHLYLMQSRYPNRKIEPFFLRHLEEAVGQPRIALEHREPSRPLSGQHRWALVGALVVVIVAALLGGVLHWRDPAPATFRIQGASLETLNSRGSVLWSFQFPSELALPGNEQVRPQFVNHQGSSALVFPSMSRNALKPSSEIYTFDSRGRVSWRYKMGRSLKTPIETYPDHYVFSFVQLLDLFRDGNFQILAGAANGPWPPFQAVLLDLNGSLLGEYWHPGHLGAPAVADLDRDGRREILMGGRNEHQGRPCMVVLDPLIVGGGFAAEDPSDRWEGIQRGTEKFYVLFPADKDPDRPPSGVVKILASEQRVSAFVGRAEGDSVEYVFDPDLNLVTTHVHGKPPPHDPSEQLLYWDGLRWTYSRTLTARFLRLRK
ncbi:MAG: hypothetical protein HY652_01865 [Acidobacteria bacterium]|nr:hypothetical protein [Acidobacteriota bacterium]